MAHSDGPDPDERAGGEATGCSDQRSALDHLVEQHDLQQSLESLSKLAMRRLDLECVLIRVAELAVQAIPGADGAGLTLLEEGRSDTVVVTDPFVREVDNIQYGLRQGPCVSAAAEGKTMLSGSLGGDHRWPQFGARVARLGVHSALSLPLITADGVVGAMNIYAHDKHVFDERAARLGEQYAAPAAIAVQNAQVLAQAQRLTRQLRSALETSATVERAVGILMSRSGASASESLERLRSLSQHEHRKLGQVACQIVDEAVRRARSLHQHC